MGSPIGKTSEIIEIAPDGDLILIVGSNEAKLKVHSLLLMAASKPFSVMLGPDWKEGQDMLDSNGPSEVSLPDDNAAALKIICSVIHHQNKEVPPTLAPGDVLAVAIITDKYDCADALKFAMESWLRPSGHEAGDLMLLAAAAYVFRNAEAFKEITRALILTYDGPYLAISCNEVESIMTWKVLCLLEERRGHVRLEVAEKLIGGVFDGTGQCVHKCGWTSKYAYAYLDLLKDELLWPRHLANLSISKALEVAERMPDPIPEESSASCTYEYKHTVPAYRKNRNWGPDVFEGLCLGCIQSGTVDSACTQGSHSWKY